MSVDIIQFSTTFSVVLPASMVREGFPHVYPFDLRPVIARTVFRVGFENRARLLERLRVQYGKLAVGPRNKA